MSAITLVILAFLSQTANSPLVKSRTDLARIMPALHSPIQDFSMVYEGSSVFVGSADLKPEYVGDDPVILSYQAAFYYRNDGAAMFDLYEKGMQPDRLMKHMRNSLLRGRHEMLSATPDDGPESIRTRTSPGEPGSLAMPLSAHEFVYLWRFPGILESGPNVLEVLGSEKVENEECVKIFIDEFPQYKGKNKRTYIMWIDLSRGGHVLKAEKLSDSKPMERLHSVKLKHFRLPGDADAWFPVQASVDSFMRGGKPFTVPMFRTTYSVVSGSLKFNQKLSDQVFSVKWEGRIPPGLTASPLRREFLAAKSAPPPSTKRTDPAGIEAGLKAQLDEANRQSNLLEASSPAREPLTSTTAFQIVLLVLGGALLGFAAVRIRRYS